MCTRSHVCLIFNPRAVTYIHIIAPIMRYICEWVAAFCLSCWHSTTYTLKTLHYVENRLNVPWTHYIRIDIYSFSMNAREKLRIKLTNHCVTSSHDIYGRFLWCFFFHFCLNCLFVIHYTDTMRCCHVKHVKLICYVLDLAPRRGRNKYNFPSGPLIV